MSGTPINPKQQMIALEREVAEALKATAPVQLTIEELAGTTSEMKRAMSGLFPDSQYSQAMAIALEGVKSIAAIPEQYTYPFPELAQLELSIPQYNMLGASIINNVASLGVTAWARSVSEISNAISQHCSFANTEANDLGAAIRTAEANFLIPENNHLDEISKTLMDSAFIREFTASLEHLQPTISAFGAAVNAMSIVQVNAERGQILDWGNSNSEFAVDTAIEAHRIFDAISETDSPSEAHELFIQLLATLGGLFTRLKENTVEELRNLGLIKLISLAAVFLTIYSVISTNEADKEARVASANLQNEIDEMRGSLEVLMAAATQQENAFLQDLQRGEVARVSNIRNGPSSGATVLIKLQIKTPAALIRSEGSWRLIVYRDPLTEQLAQGWIFENRLKLF